MPLPKEITQDETGAIACSNCFRDYGLRLSLFKAGRESDTPCPQCSSTSGRKLDWSALEDACTDFFVCGSTPTGRGIFAPLIQINKCHGSSDRFGTAELNADIDLLERVYGLYCFYYGPPLWQFGKPPGEDGQVEWSDEDLEYLIDHCQEQLLSERAILYRVQLDVLERQLSDERFCSPPDALRTKFWRFDSDEVTICYTAFDVETCLHESRVTLQHNIFVATLELERDLRFLDLSSCKGPGEITPFENPAIWLGSLLYDGDDSYGVCRRLAARIRSRNFDGFTYASFFQQAAERTHVNAAVFGTPIRSGILRVASINNVRLNNMAYNWQYGPVVVDAFQDIDHNE
jgi:hypothetical protein